MTLSWDRLHGYPTPGDPGALHARHAEYANVYEQAKQAFRELGRLKSATGASTWTGAGAARFEELLHQAQPQVLDLASAHQEAANLVRMYAAGLVSRKRRADDLLLQATRAQASVDDALHERDTLGSRLVSDLSDERSYDQHLHVLRLKLVVLHGSAEIAVRDELRRYSSLLAAAQDRVRRDRSEVAAADGRISATSNELARVQGAIDALRCEHKAAATGFGAALLAVVGLEPHSPHAIVRFVQQNVSATAAATGAFLDESLDNLDDYAAVVGIVALVAGAALLVAATGGLAVPAVAAVAAAVTGLGTLSTALTALSAAGHVFQAANGKEGFDTSLLAIGGLALGGASKGMALLEKSAMSNTAIAGAKHQLGAVTLHGGELSRTGVSAAVGDFIRVIRYDGPSSAAGFPKMLARVVEVPPTFTTEVTAPGAGKLYFALHGTFEALHSADSAYDAVDDGVRAIDRIIHQDDR